MRRSNLKQFLAIGVGLLVIAASVLPTAVTYAAEPAAPARQIDDERLELFLQRLNLILDKQALHLETAGEAADLTQEWIDLLAEEGKDTAGLQAALDAYRDGLAEAQASHDEAAAILAAPAGFDAEGQVTDRPTALETVRSAGRALRAAHFALVQANLALRSAVVEFRANS